MKDWKEKFPQDNRYFEVKKGILYNGDVLEVLRTFPDESVNCIVTSPPYWRQRDYSIEDQIGQESSLESYLEKLLNVTKELWRVLKRNGIMFWNHGDCYPDKSLALQNYRLLLRMVDEQGWCLRNVVIWYKPNAKPESVTDRFYNTYEPVFMLVKRKKIERNGKVLWGKCEDYWCDLDAVRLPHSPSTEKRVQYLTTAFGGDDRNSLGSFGKGLQSGAKAKKVELNPLGRNPGDVWFIPTQGFSARKLGLKDVDHFAVFPEALVNRILLFACPLEICKKCGTPRERIVSKNYVPTRPSLFTGTGKSGTDDDLNKSLHRRDISKYRMKIEYYAKGWTDCGCGAGFEPGIVLDPFMGSGTTAVVAEKLGRRWVGIELNPDYCEIIKRRVLLEETLF